MSRIAAGAGLALLIWLCAPPAHATTGAWERAWGKDVGGTDVKLCIVASACQGGWFGSGDGEFDTAQGIAVAPSGDVYVVDTDQYRVEKFDSNGTWLRTFGSQGVQGGQFGHPVDVAVGVSGDVYVTDPANGRINEFSSDGNFVQAWGKNVDGVGGNVCGNGVTPCMQGSVGHAGGEFDGPTGIGTDASGNVYVADMDNHVIQKFNANGVFQLMWGSSVTGVGAGPQMCMNGPSCVGGTSGFLGGEMSKPNDVAVDSNGNVYVADTGNVRVQQFDTSGGFVRAWGKGVEGGGTDLCVTAANCTAGSAGTQGGQFDGLQFIAADSSDGVYVSEFANNRIQRFNSSGNFKRAWGKGVDSAKPGVFSICTVASACQQGTAGVLGGETSNPYGVAVGPGGVLYESDFTRIQKFVLAPPALSTVTPSPANNNTPVVHGSVEPATTVDVYRNAACAGVPIVFGDDIAFNSAAGLQFHVPDDSTSTLYAATTDELGQVSACSSIPLTYVEDSTAPDTLLDSPPSGVISDSAPPITFHATEPTAIFMCRFDSDALAHCPGPTVVPSSPLPDGPHTFDVVATDVAGNTDPSPARAAFSVDTTTPPPPLPAPQIGRLVNAIPEKGTVLVKVPATAGAKAHAAASRFVPLGTLGAQVPVGSTLDTTRGTVRLTAATTNSGTKTQVGHFNGGLFVLGQGRKNPLTTVSMTGGALKSCGKVPRGGSPKVRAAAKRRTLFSNVHGRFRSRGRNSTATVRGTRWRMTDTCKGTLTVVTRGSVVVRDLRKHRTVTLTQGHHYLASSLRKR